jgi:peptidoglycan/xylan/chitin deacetylase (PgdA/CDA1 family)
MKLLHNIGVSPSGDPRISSNYNTREEILACDEPLSFDGVYLNVWENRDILKGKDVTLFVMGAYVGKDNSFDAGMPLERYCTWEQILELVDDYGCKLGWHTETHPDLTALPSHSDLPGMAVIKEVMPPAAIVDDAGNERPFPKKVFAYPYGRFNNEVKKIVELCGYDEAWSVTQGDGSRFAKVRTYLNK